MRFPVAGAVSLLLTAVLVVGGYAFFPGLTPIRADDTEYETIIDNPLIDCSTNSGYRDEFIAEVFQKSVNSTKNPKATRGATNANACSACHQDDHPEVGSGKPQARQASILVYNRLNKAVDIETRSGATGEWKSQKLQPRAIQKITYRYKGDSKKSPIYYLKYKGDPLAKVRKMVPLATPNPYLGNVYFFDKGDDNQVRFYQPENTVARRSR